MSFRDVLKADAINVFCNPDELGEPEGIMYRPKDGTARPINAVVERNEDEPYGADENSQLPYLVINVANDPVLGIAITELKPGKDQIEVAVRTGDKPERRTITALKGQDEGMLELECR